MKESQINILINLATFKFMTTKQMLARGVLNDKHHLYTVLKEISRRNKPYIKKHTFSARAEYGRLFDVYYLTRHGRNFLVEELLLEPEEIRYPIGRNVMFLRDYNHRISTINIHIGLVNWLDTNNSEILSASAYFDKPGNQRTGTPLILNKIEINEHKYFIPDLITKILVDDKEYNFVWEQHNGKDTKKLLRQIENHIEGLKARLIGKRLGNNKLHRVGLVFEHKSIMESSMKRLMEKYGDSSDLYRCFIFKTNEDIEPDFKNRWYLWNGQITEILR